LFSPTKAIVSSKAEKINAETVMMGSTAVVKQDTASCDIVHGSSRTKITAEINMRHSTVVNKDFASISDICSTKDNASNK
jgi:hypothetical protein